MKKRCILHSDLNNFYASVECLRRPELRNVPVAVCGSFEDRHGVVLAKNMPAKQMGVKTGEVFWQARQKCPDLISVPADFPAYVKISRAKNLLRYFSLCEQYLLTASLPGKSLLSVKVICHDLCGFHHSRDHLFLTGNHSFQVEALILRFLLECDFSHFLAALAVINYI